MAAPRKKPAWQRPRCWRVLWLLVLFFTGSIAAWADSVAAGDVTSNGEMSTLAPMLDHVLPAVVSVAVRGEVELEANPLFSDLPSVSFLAFRRKGRWENMNFGQRVQVSSTILSGATS